MADLGKGILQGKKTYVAGIIGILGAIAGYLTGDIDMAQTGQLLLTAILGMTIRHGVSNQ